MSRKPRIHYPDALYHVIVKGNNGEKIFATEVDKREYLEKLSVYKQKFYFKLLAFCLMDNHAHLLIQVSDTPLSTVMQRIQQVYTQWYNKKYDHTGHVFQQRYKALLCDKENYLLQLIKYIHYNPVKANISNNLNYKWSSHVHYTKMFNGLVDIHEVLPMFAPDINRAVEQYLQFMEQETEELRSKDHLEFMLKSYQPPQSSTEAGQLDIQQLIEMICCQENVCLAEITRKTRVQKISDIRKAIILLSEKHCKVSNTSLALILNLPLSMVSKIKSGESKGTEYVHQIMYRFERNKGIIQA